MWIVNRRIAKFNHVFLTSKNREVGLRGFLTRTLSGEPEDGKFLVKTARRMLFLEEFAE